MHLSTKFTEMNIFFLLHQYHELMRKKRIVENDKSKILETIDELDRKKTEALHMAWKKV